MKLQLLKGDCLELLKTIESQSIDMVLADPPYGTTACKWDSVIPFEPMWAELKRIIKPNGAIVLFGSEPFSSALRMSNIKQYKYDWVWDKVSKTGHLNAKKQPMRQVELCHVFYKKQPTYNPQMIKLTDAQLKVKLRKKCKKNSENFGIYGKNKTLGRDEVDIEKYGFNYPSNIIEISSYSGECNLANRLHPTQKPVALLEYLIKTYTQDGETVLDFTMGSGSTGVAAKNLNRNFIGIELDEKYFAIAEKRINDA